MRHPRVNLSQPQGAQWSWAGLSDLALVGVEEVGKAGLYGHTVISHWIQPPLESNMALGQGVLFISGNLCIGLPAVGRINSSFLREDTGEHIIMSTQ